MVNIINYSTIIPGFCNFLIKDVVKLVACRYQHSQNHPPLDAEFSKSKLQSIKSWIHRN